MEKVHCPFHKKITTFIRNLSSSRVIPKKENEKVAYINQGPESKKIHLSLRTLDDLFIKEEWEEIQNFKIVPNVQRIYDFETNKLREKWEEELSKRPEKLKIEKERCAQKMLQSDKEYRKFKKWLSEKAEISLQNKIKAIFNGRPGLLIRNVENDKDTFKVLSELLGKEIAPNCNCKEEGVEHKRRCYDFEADLILLFPTLGKLCIRLIEVKRPDSVPFAEKIVPSINKELVNKGLEQLEKDVKFILDFLPDVPSENLDIKALIAFPETSCSSKFCPTCADIMITGEDMQNKTEILKKLAIKTEEIMEFPLNKDFWKACARLLGKASLLHDGVRKAADKDRKEKEIIHEHEKDLEDNFCIKILSPEQRDSLYQVKIGSKPQNFIFAGGSGTGKSIMGMLSLAKLVNLYIEEDTARNVNVYISIHCYPYYKEHPELLKILRNSPKFKDMEGKENVNIKILTERSLVNEVFEWESEEKQEVYKMGLTLRLQKILNKLHEKHRSEPVLLFMDEISAPDGTRKLDLSSLSSPRCDVHLILALSPVCDVGKPWTIEDKFKLPTDESFLKVSLNLRYRNTRQIQMLTEHLGSFKKNYLSSGFDISFKKDVPIHSGAAIEGNIPEWTDVGSYTLKVYAALKRIRSKIGENDEVVLLWHFEEKTLGWESLKKEGFLDYFTKPRTCGGYGWRMVDYGDFQGAESDVVVYLGPGGIEGLSRAKRKLYIITYHTPSGLFADKEGPYDEDREALRDAVKQNLLLKHDISKDNVATIHKDIAGHLFRH